MLESWLPAWQLWGAGDGGIFKRENLVGSHYVTETHAFKRSYVVLGYETSKLL